MAFDSTPSRSPCSTCLAGRRPARQVRGSTTSLRGRRTRRDPPPGRAHVGRGGWIGPEPVPGRAVRRGGPRGSRAMATLGAGREDRVGIFMPMIPETVIAVLAVEAMPSTPPSSPATARRPASRLADPAGKAAGHRRRLRRRGKQIAMKPVADAALADAPTVERCLVVRRLWADGGEVPWTRAERDEAVAAAEGSPGHRSEPMPKSRTCSSTPVGRRDRPKGAIHARQGFPLKSAVDLATSRPSARRRPVLVHRHGLDDGSVGGAGALLLARPWSTPRS